jgi:AcrR family transcriptional regulator
LSKQTSGPAPDASTVAGHGRMAGGERHLQILRVAMSLFSQRGFRGTTTKEIAQAAGVSEAMVFRHFATKEELYSAILDQKACSEGMEDPRDQFAEAIERKDDRALFEELATAMLQHHENDTEFLLLLNYAALEGHELAEMFWDRTVLPFYQFLTTYIRERQRDGAIRDIDAAVVVRAFIGMIMHHALNNALWDKTRRVVNIGNESAARDFTDILLNGISASAPRGQERPRPARTGRRKRSLGSPQPLPVAQKMK